MFRVRLMMTIGDVSTETGVKKSILTQWCRRYGIEPIQRRSGTQKAFRREHVKALAAIRHLLAIEGLSHFQIARLVYAREPVTEDIDDLVCALRHSMGMGAQRRRNRRATAKARSQIVTHNSQQSSD